MFSRWNSWLYNWCYVGFFLAKIDGRIPVTNPRLIYGAMLFRMFFWRLLLALYGMLFWMLIQTLIGMPIGMIIVMLIGMLIGSLIGMLIIVQNSAIFKKGR